MWDTWVGSRPSGLLLCFQRVPQLWELLVEELCYLLRLACAARELPLPEAAWGLPARPGHDVLWHERTLGSRVASLGAVQTISEDTQGQRVGCRERFPLLSEALAYQGQTVTSADCTNKTSSCGVLFYFLVWSFSLNFSTSISRQWLLISPCRSYL